MACSRKGVGLFYSMEGSPMSGRMKNVLVVVVIALAFGIVGYMDSQDAQCSWNGCGDSRYTQE